MQRKALYLAIVVLCGLASLVCRLPIGWSSGEPAESPLPIGATASPTSIHPPSPLPTRTSAPGGAIITPIPSETPAVALEIDPQQLSAGDPYAPELGNRGYDVQWYELKLVLDPAASELTAVVTIRAQSTRNDLKIISLDFVGFEIQQLLVDGATAAFERRGQKLLVVLPRSRSKGESFETVVAYHGAPVQQRSPFIPFAPHLGLFFQPEERRMFVASEPDGAHTWYPCNDHPRDKAAYRFELLVPQGLVGVAIGELVEVQHDVSGAFPDGRVGDVYRWQTGFPVATAFVTVAVGDYVELKGSSPAGIELRHYIYPEKVAQFEPHLAEIGEMIDWMGGLYGVYPFEAFGYVMIDGLNASLETQTMVLLDAGAVASEETLVHEMAHMWFGDWVSLDSWGEMWRSEGFATYTSALWESRGDPAGLEAAMEAYQQTLNSRPPDYRLDAPPPDKLFDWNIYLKGALLAHALRQQVGDEAFFNGLRLYFKRYGGGSASQMQFKQVLEEVSGMELTAFFESWFR